MQAHLAASAVRRAATRVGASRRRPPTGAGRPVADADLGSRAAGILDLQRACGNRAVAELLSTHAGNGTAGSVRLHGRTRGEYDGGSSTILNRKVKRATGCDCPDEAPCLTATGTLRVSYHVAVTITMPDMPSGLSDCQERRVRTFLREVLGPHEQDHARRLRSYDGTTNRRFSVTACGQQALTSDVNDQLQQMHDTEADQRAAAADASSAAIDPFEREIDLDC